MRHKSLVPPDVRAALVRQLPVGRRFPRTLPIAPRSTSRGPRAAPAAGAYRTTERPPHCVPSIGQQMVVVALSLMLTAAGAGLYAQTASRASAADRSIDFTTSEGTWISLDVSPSGSVLVFELLGDLYTLPIAGGEAKPIVTGTAFQSQPRFAPDGHSLAYVSDESGSDNLWLAQSDGSSPRRLTNVARSVLTSPSFSTDGTSLLVTVIAVHTRAAELWRFDVATGAGTRLLKNDNGPASQLVSAPPPGPFGAAPSSDGRYALFASVTPRHPGARVGGTSRLLRLELSTGNVDTVPVLGTNAMTPRLSPDGLLLAYGAQSDGHTGLKIRRLSTGAESWLRYPLQGDELEARPTRDLLPSYAFTPDSRAVVVAFGGKIHRLDIASLADEVIPFVARVQMTLPPAPTATYRVAQGPVRSRFAQHPALASDGRTAFSAFGRVYVAGRVGRVPRRLTSTVRAREFHPAWSPDGRWVAFTTWTSAGGALWKARPDGSAPPVRLTSDSSYYAQPAWSGDGTRLTFLRAPAKAVQGRRFGLPPETEIAWVSAAGGTPAAVSTAGALRRPQWSPDGQRIDAYSQADGLVSLAIDGGSRRVRARLKQPPASLPLTVAPSGGAVSPDGRNLVVHIGDRLVRFALTASDTALQLLDPAVVSGAQLLSDDAPDAFTWAPNAKSLGWVSGRQLRVTPVGQSAVFRVDSGEVVIETARATPTGTLVLRGAKVVTMRDDEVIENADVVIRDNRIVGVGLRGTVTVPLGSRVMDVAGRTIIPGLIDLHAHLGVSSDVIEPDASFGLANLAFGITTVRDPQVVPEVFAYADMADAGEMLSPRIYATGPGIFPDLDVSSLTAARRIAHEYRDRYGTPYLKSYMMGSREQRRWIAQAAAELGMRATSEGGADFKEDLTHALDAYSGNEHSLPSAPLYRDVVQFLAQSGMVYTPTLIVAFGGALPTVRYLTNPKLTGETKLLRFVPAEQALSRVGRFPASTRLLDYREGAIGAGAAAILRAGGTVGLGGHGEMQGLSNHWEMELLASGGLTPHEVLHVATRNGAHALGLAQDLGTVEAGKLADLVVLERDPLTDIRHTTSIGYVVKNGVMYEGETLRRVWPDTSALPEPWWARRRPPVLPAAALFDEAAVDAVVKREMERMRVPGLAVGVVKGGEVLMAKGYGLANLEHNVPVTSETMFQSGSLGKQFTAAGILALIEDGKLTLDTPLRAVLPDAPASWDAIRIRHLLSHTSGIPDYTGDQLDYRKDYRDDDFKKLAYALPLEFPAGARWNYSNTGYVLLGIVMGQVTAKPYWEFLRERIFTPAGMRTVRVISESEVVSNRAAGYLVADGRWVNQTWVAPVTNTTADGSMLLSLRDMLAWNDVVRTKSILRRESWELAMSPVTLTSGRRYPYGFAWFVDTLRGAPVLQHGGAWQGFRTQYTRFATGDVAVVVLANARTASTDVIASAIAAAVDPGLAPVPEPTQSIADNAPAVTQYVSGLLERISRGDLTLGDFEVVRQTVFPRMRDALSRALQGLGAPERLDLLARRPVGDDVTYTYRARYGTRLFLVVASIGPQGRLTGLRVDPRGS